MHSKSMFGCVRIFKNKLLLIQSKCSVHGKVNGVQIPARIERKPTDILKSLSKTVSPKSIHLSYDAQYGVIFHDLDAYAEKVSRLSKESGRKAAKWIVSQNPKFFQYKACAPYIEAFAPPKILNEESEVSEETLLKAIQMIQVEYAIDVYKLLKTKSIDVSESTKQKLLELACYYNSSNKQDVTLVTESFEHDIYEKVENTWKKKGFHMDLFHEMDKNAESYSAVIMGMFKYNNCVEGFNLFRKAEKMGIKFGVDVYNSILIELYKAGDFYEGEATITHILREMNEMGIKPNLETLNKVLQCILQMRKYFPSKFFAVRVVNEFRRIGIKPSLTTFYHLLILLYPRKERSRARDESVKWPLIEILEEIENETPELLNETDFVFFSRAMETAYLLQDVKLAKRIDDLLKAGDNAILLNRNTSERYYYHNFLKVVFQYGKLDEAAAISDKIFLDWSFEVKNFKDIIEILEARANGGIFLELVWKYIKNYKRNLKWVLYEGFLRVLDKKGHQLDGDSFHEIAKEIWEIFKSDPEESIKSEGTSRLLAIFSREKDKILANEVFDFILNNMGGALELDFPSLKEFLKFCHSCEDKAKAMICIDYVCRIQSLDAGKLIKFMKSTFELDEDDLNKLDLLNRSLVSNTDEIVE